MFLFGIMVYILFIYLNILILMTLYKISALMILSVDLVLTAVAAAGRKCPVCKMINALGSLSDTKDKVVNLLRSVGRLLVPLEFM